MSAQRKSAQADAPAQRASERFGASAGRIAWAALRLRESGIVVALAIAVLFFSLRADNFATLDNWQDILTNAAIVVVVAVGQTFVVLTRNIDLSVGSVVGLSAYISSETLADHPGASVVAIALLAIGIGLVCGVINGLLVAIGRIPAIIATLGTLAIFRGVLIDVSNGQAVLAHQLPDSFANLASRTPLGVPLMAWLAVAVVVVGAVVLRWAPWGRDLYAVGSGPDSARLVGIPVRRRVIASFAVSGALAGLGGFIFSAQYVGVDVTAAQGFEINVVTAVVIGGVNLFGGSGGAVGAALGALLVATIADGFNLLRLSEFWTIFFNGVAIVVIVAIDSLVRERLRELLRHRRRAELIAAHDAGARP